MALTTLVAVSLKSPNFCMAVTILARSASRTSSAGGMVWSASVIWSLSAARVLVSRSSAVMAALKLSRCSSTVPMNVFKRVISSRTSPSRPVSAVAVLCIKSPICPSPPALTTTDSEDSVCSVDGYTDDRFNAIVDPGASLPRGCSPTGGSSARCMDPSRLVCPIRAIAFSGTITSGLTRTSTTACQFRTPILPTLPTTTSSIMTGEFDSSVTDIGDLDVVDRVARTARDRTGQRQ